MLLKTLDGNFFRCGRADDGSGNGSEAGQEIRNRCLKSCGICKVQNSGSGAEDLKSATDGFFFLISLLLQGLLVAKY